MKKICLYGFFLYGFLSIFSMIGAISWIDLYLSKRYSDWWGFILIILCGLVSIIYLVLFIKNIINLIKS